MKKVLSGALFLFICSLTPAEFISQTIALQRGPYLQTGTPTSVIVRWKTDVNGNAQVNYGTNPANLNLSATDPASATEHTVLIQNLLPSTKYYYSISSNGTLLSAADSFQYFKTSPLTGVNSKFRFWAIGDAGNGSTNQKDVRDAFLNYNNGEHVDGWIMLGDNAYESGYESEYQANVFTNMYEQILKNTVLWPAIGNHDYNNHIPFSPDPAYFDIFNLPTAGEAGGLASGTEKYYSYDYGNVHFISLDSYDESRSATGPMATWLQNDLNANTLPWTVVYFHHPPYTKGTHDSDNPWFYDFEMPEIRQNILPILEGAGVDLVLNGHSHVYERSFLIDGHYGTSSQLQSSMILDNGSGTYPAACPYKKNDIPVKSHKGTVYVVCGCSGKNGSVASGWPHPVMYSYTNSEYGSLLIEIEDNQLDLKFINALGNVHDAFTIVKNASKTHTINACPGDQLVLKPSWKGNVQWFPGNSTADSLVLTATVSTFFFANEPMSCFKDTFYINVTTGPPCNITTGIYETNAASLTLFPSALNPGETLFLKFASDGDDQITVRIVDMNGRIVHTEKTNYDFINESCSITTPTLQQGIYIAEVKTETVTLTKRIIILNQ